MVAAIAAATTRCICQIALTMNTYRHVAPEVGGRAWSLELVRPRDLGMGLADDRLHGPLRLSSSWHPALGGKRGAIGCCHTSRVSPRPTRCAPSWLVGASAAVVQAG